MNTHSSAFWRLAAILALPLLLVACFSTPDADEMRELRHDAAQTRLAALDARTPYEGRGIFLSGPLSLADALEKALAFNLSLQQEVLGRETAAAQIQSAYQNVLPSLVASGGYTRLDDDLAATDENGVSRRGRYVDHSSAAVTVSQPLFLGTNQSQGVGKCDMSIKGGSP